MRRSRPHHLNTFVKVVASSLKVMDELFSNHLFNLEGLQTFSFSFEYQLPTVIKGHSHCLLFSIATTTYILLNQSRVIVESAAFKFLNDADQFNVTARCWSHAGHFKSDSWPYSLVIAVFIKKNGS